MTTAFNYELLNAGWAKFSIANEANGIEAGISYLADPLKDLIEGLTKLLKNDSTFQKVSFPEEPGETFLFLTLQGDDVLEIEIFWNDDWTSENDIKVIVETSQKIYSDIDTLSNFAKLVHTGITNLLEEHGEIGYAEKWLEYAFPMSDYLELTKLLQHTN